MTLADLKEKLLALTTSERAELAHFLLISLDEDDIVKEAEKRAKEIDEGKVETIAEDVVSREAHSLLK